MKVIETISEMKEFIKENKSDQRTIGLVPTMGFLHDGHVSLLKKSVSENQITVLSIYVNPVQFGPGEDFEKYPRDTKRDMDIAASNKVDAVFLPDSREMYPDGYLTYVNVEKITEKLCGETRPGHFRGVATVVLKLFNIIKPDKAYFGIKDAQQLAVLKRMTRDLNLDTTIVECPIVREKDGLAMSSRNVYLSAQERERALLLSKTLMEAKELFESSCRNVSTTLEFIRDSFLKSEGVSLEYAEILDKDTFQPPGINTASFIALLAARVGKTRLIDNILL